MMVMQTESWRQREFVRLVEHLRREVFAIFRMAEELSPEAEELEGRVKAVAAKLKDLSDQCEHHIEDMEPAEEEDEAPSITEDSSGRLMKSAVRRAIFPSRFCSAPSLWGISLRGGCSRS